MLEVSITVQQFFYKTCVVSMICHKSIATLYHCDHLWLRYGATLDKCVFLFTQCCLLSDLTTKSQRTWFGYIPLSPISMFVNIVFFRKCIGALISMHYFVNESISLISTHVILCHVTKNILRGQLCDPKNLISWKYQDIKWHTVLMYQYNQI